MQDQTSKPPQGHEMSRQSSVRSFHRPYSHCSESDDDDDLEEMSRRSSVHSFHGPFPHCSESEDDDLKKTSGALLSGHSRISDDQHVSSTRETSGDLLVSDSAPMSEHPPIPADPPHERMSNNPQMHNNQPMPDDSLIPEFRTRHGYPSTDSYPPTHSYYPTHDYPPIYALTFHLPLIPGYPLPYGHPYMEPDHHPSPKPHACCSTSSPPRPSTPGMEGRGSQPGAELRSPLHQGPPLKYHAIDTHYPASVQTSKDNPARLHFSPGGSIHRGAPSKNTQLSHTEMPTMEDPEEIIIAVMGVTGTGKSYFIQEVSGISDVVVSSGLHSCTTEVRPYSFPYAGVKITLVDTPGFNDTTKTDIQVLLDISTWMSSNYKKKKLLSGVIFLHNINDVRMSGTSVKCVKMFERLCGPNAMPNVLLTTTQWYNVDQGLGEKRERELLSGDFWGGLIRDGASVERFMGTRESGLELIDKLIGNQPKPLKIQQEIVDEKKAIAETNAGEFVNEELISLQKKFQKDLQDLRRDLQTAIREKDDLLKEILEEQRAQSQKKQEEAEAQRKFLEGFRADMMKEREEAEDKKQKERERRDRAVIAVASEDIGSEVHLQALFTSYSTRGRLICNINDEKEFEKGAFEVEIRHQNNILSPIKHLWKAFVDPGMSNESYIIYNQGYYQCKPSRSVRRCSRNFVIFAKY